MENFIKQRKRELGIVVLGFILNILSIRFGFIDCTFFFALLYVLVQTNRLLEPIDRTMLRQIGRIVGTLFAGLTTCFCLASAIGINCINPKFRMHGALIVVYILVGVLFPIIYNLFITSILSLKSYMHRGCILMVWSLTAMLYFKFVAQNPPVDADEAGCLGISTIPMWIAVIPLIVFLYGIYLIRLHKDSL